jgi:hypothetical protein
MAFTPIWLACGTGAMTMSFEQEDSKLDCWRSVEGGLWRAYHYGEAPVDGDFHWVALDPLLDLTGASQGEEPTHHYVVETDVSTQALEEFTAWYDTEHMPGLARVPGTVRARRFKRLEGSPRFIACYDLTSPLTLERPEWLAVRHTPWSDRVRPMFRGTVRTMYQRAHLCTS